MSLERFFAKEEREKKSEVEEFKEEIVGAIQGVSEQNKQLMSRFNEFCGIKPAAPAELHVLNTKLSGRRLEGISPVKTLQVQENKI